MKSLTRSGPHEGTRHGHVLLKTGGLATVISDEVFVMWDKAEMVVGHGHMSTPNIKVRTRLPFRGDPDDSIHCSEAERVLMIQALSNEIADAAPLKSTGKRLELSTIDGPTLSGFPCHGSREQCGSLLIYVAIIFTANVCESA